MATKWIGPDYSMKAIGDVGFLVDISNPFRGSARYELRDIPPHTNQSYEPRLHGWCGTWNDTATHGCGMARVERVAKNGRVLVRILEGDQLFAALEDLGYPELAG